ncbi:YceD family protein [Sporosarcina ureilytica]|nr:YceD family protein [Sporosarcina ureilytica]
MKWSINQLQRYRQGNMPFDEMVNLESVIKRNPEIRAIAPVHVTGSCKIGEGKVECNFQLEGTLVLPCARTWEDADFPFSIQSTETFGWDENVLQADDEIHPVEGDFVELNPIFEELILLEIPLQVYSERAEDMKKVDGKGWSYTTDEAYSAHLEESKPKVDPRLASLADFFDKKDE